MLCDETMRKEILSRLSGYRLEHTLGCERAAVMLAKRFGADEAKDFLVKNSCICAKNTV